MTRVFAEHPGTTTDGGAFSLLSPAVPTRDSKCLPTLLVALSALAASPIAGGEGFRSPTTGAAGLATTGGRIVFVDDASAVFHNPANLLDLPRWEVSAEPTIVHHSVSYESPSGGTAQTTDPWKLLPHLFMGGPVLDDRVALGLGISVPFGLSIDWEPDGALRYVAPRYVQLKTINANPSASFRVVEGLNVGVGLDVMYSELTLSQYTPWSLIAGVPGLPDGEIRAQATGVGVSGNLGITWEFLERHRLAVTLRAPMDIDYTGDLRAWGVPTSANGELLLPFESEIRYPTMLAFGYGIRVTDRLRLEANGEWMEFSRFETLPLKLPVSLPTVPSEVPQNWKDTFTAGFSATYDLGSGWRVRASYQYFESPVPDETFSPTIPDANQHAVACGVGYRKGRHRLDLAYSRVFYEDRNIEQNQNPFYIGRYEIDVHLISAAYGLSF
ncbi:MAG: outer membrane protein transport protein [Verrucomicrobiales bacterium]|nr:outer membrane protein transport protein [Verrucomicrobiales bacterium]